MLFYHALGFKDTDKEQKVKGIRFTPIKYENKSVRNGDYELQNN